MGGKAAFLRHFLYRHFFPEQVVSHSEAQLFNIGGYGQRGCFPDELLQCSGGNAEYILKFVNAQGRIAQILLNVRKDLRRGGIGFRLGLDLHMITNNAETGQKMLQQKLRPTRTLKEWQLY